VKRLVCIVEGKGEVQAIPSLCWSIFRYLGVEGWIVDEEPIRQSRSKLVDERVPGPRRPSRSDQLQRFLAIARARPGHAALILCDADDDCPATWGPHAVRAIPPPLSGAAVMASREYETWLLHDLSDARGIESKRGAKEALRRLVPNYDPTTHQLLLTRKLDVPRVRARSDSFDKLVRDLARLCGAKPPKR
jgi:hypothetical protein